MTVDLSYTREAQWLIADQVPGAPNPTKIILQPNGVFNGVLQNGLAVANQPMLQDVNPQNYAGNPNGYLATYQHNFTTIGTNLLFDLTDKTVYDLNAYDSSTLTIVWPQSF